MDLASGIFATVAVGMQIFETIQKTRKFLQSVQNAPHEVKALLRTLDQLHLTIEEVNSLVEQHQKYTGLPYSTKLLEMALQNCYFSVKSLDVTVNDLQTKFARARKIRRAWISVAVTLKREDIEKLQSRIAESMSYLTTALLINSSNFAMYQSELLSPARYGSRQDYCNLDSEPTVNLKSKEVYPGNLLVQHTVNTRQLATKTTDIVLHKSPLGFIQYRTIAKFFGSNCQLLIKPLSELNSVMINVPLLRTAIKYEYQSSICLPRSLGLYPVMDSESAVFDMCRWGHIEEFQRLLIEENISPFLQDEEGNTMLHHAIENHNIELCPLILGLGVDPDHTNVMGQKALASGLSYDITSYSSMGDLLTILASAQDEVSLYDLDRFSQVVRSPRTVDRMVSILSGLDERTREEIHDFALVSVLRTCTPPFGCTMNDWLPACHDFIKSLFQEPLRVTGEGFNLLGDERGNHSGDRDQPMTLLDNLFLNCEDPFDSHILSRFWLNLLLQEGFDIHSYLQQEESLHSSRQNQTSPVAFSNPDYKMPRTLVFQYGEMPLVTWQWWVDPGLPGSLVCNEFKNMNIHHRTDRPFVVPWVSTWPFEYPDWWDCCRPWYLCDDGEDFLEWQQINDLGKSRLARRAKGKLIKHNRAYNRHQCMPGSWPD